MPSRSNHHSADEPQVGGQASSWRAVRKHRQLTLPCEVRAARLLARRHSSTRWKGRGKTRGQQGAKAGTKRPAAKRPVKPKPLRRKATCRRQRHMARRGLRFESGRELKVPANRQFLLPEQTQCCRAVWRGSRSSQFAGTCRSETFQDRSEGTLRQHASPKNEVIVTSAPRVDDLERSRAVRKSQRGRFFVYTRARDETDEQALVAEPASTRPAPRWRYGLSPVSQLCQLAANASPPGVGTLCARLWQRRPRLPALS